MATSKVLVVDDEQSVAMTIKAILELDGSEVTAVTSGAEALVQIREHEFDVVLTDLSLPECSGLDVARSVKRMQPDTPVVLVTGWGHLLNPERLRESGVDLMLVKPFRLERLLSILGEALRLRPSA